MRGPAGAVGFVVSLPQEASTVATAASAARVQDERRMQYSPMRERYGETNLPDATTVQDGESPP
jgi:hypothetical protein